MEETTRFQSKSSDRIRAGDAALTAAAEHVGPSRTIIVMVSPSDPWGVELGSEILPAEALHLLELAVLKLRMALGNP